MEFEEGELYEVDELPDNKMNKSGNLEWVDDNTLALATETDNEETMLLEFEFSHVRCTDVSYVTETGEVVDSREELS